MNRHLRRITELDPERDHEEIYRICAGYEFPWDFEQALSLAFFKTYCVPSISGLLEATGALLRQTQKRFDDTRMLMAEVIEHGYDSPRGKTALRQVNRSHSHYTIANDDSLYVLSTFLLEPGRWIARYGKRPLTGHEKTAAVRFYTEVGKRMGIRDIPASYADFDGFNVAYERDRFVPAPSNTALANGTVDLFCSWYPAQLRPFLRHVAVALMEEPVRVALGLPPAPRWMTALAHVLLLARGRVLRFFPARRRLKITRVPNITYPGYPDGYQVGDLGAGPPPAGIDPAWLATRSAAGRRTDPPGR
jgi:hypothetical protein